MFMLKNTNHNFETIKWVKVKSIKKIGNKMTYDISMDIENGASQNYLVNGFISHNCMFLKTYYPTEYFAAMTSVTLNKDKVYRIIKEYRREGYKLFPININKSKKTFIIDGEGLRIGFTQIKGIGDKAADNIIKNQPYKSLMHFEDKLKGLRIGFTQIKGIGDKAADNIIKNQPYKSLMHFEDKLKGLRITKTIKEKLLKLGAFEGLDISSSMQPNLFEKSILEITNQNYNLEEIRNICPLMSDFQIEKKYKPFFEKYAKQYPQLIGELPEESSDDVVLIGIAYDKNLKDVIEEALKKGKPKPEWVKEGESQFCNFLLEDDSDFITIRVSPKSYKRFGKLIFEELKENDVIMVKGRIGSGIRMVFANYIVKLEDVKRKIESKIKLNETERELFKT